MKALSTAILLLSSMLCFAQDNAFHGTWRLDVNQAIDDLGPEHRVRYDTLADEVKQRIISSLEGREFTFETSGNVYVKWKSARGQETANGQWRLVNGELIITVQNVERRYTPEFRGSDALVLRSPANKGMLDNFWLIKVN